MFYNLYTTLQQYSSHPILSEPNDLAINTLHYTFYQLWILQIQLFPQEQSEIGMIYLVT